jgi:hypothetical protein
MNCMEEKDCALCGRTLAEPFNKHHLLPLSKGGKNTPTILLHKICHDKIHSVFTETELKRYYHTMDRMKENQEVQRFLKWICKKEPGFYDRSARLKRCL